MTVLKIGIGLCIFQLVAFLLIITTGYQWFTIELDPYRISAVAYNYMFFILAGILTVKYNTKIVKSALLRSQISEVKLHKVFWVFLIAKYIFMLRLLLYILANPSIILRSLWFENETSIYVYGSYLLSWLDRSLGTILIIFAFSIAINNKRLFPKLLFGTAIFLESLISAGRFSIYFIILLVLSKSFTNKNKVPAIVFSILMVLIALIITITRADNKLDFIDLVVPAITNVFEYHILPPFYLYEALGYQPIEQLPTSFGTGAFSWLLLALRGIVLNTSDLPYFTITEITQDTILHSEVSGAFFNAFSTAFIIPYIDFGLLGAIFNGLYFFVLFSSLLRFAPKGVLTVSIANFLGAIYFMSLFVPYLYSPGLGWLMIMTLIIYGVVVPKTQLKPL